MRRYARLLQATPCTHPQQQRQQHTTHRHNAQIQRTDATHTITQAPQNTNKKTHTHTHTHVHDARTWTGCSAVTVMVMVARMMCLGNGTTATNIMSGNPGIAMNPKKNPTHAPVKPCSMNMPRVGHTQQGCLGGGSAAPGEAAVRTTGGVSRVPSLCEGLAITITVLSSCRLWLLLLLSSRSSGLASLGCATCRFFARHRRSNVRTSMKHRMRAKMMTTTPTARATGFGFSARRSRVPRGTVMMAGDRRSVHMDQDTSRHVNTAWTTAGGVMAIMMSPMSVA